MKNKKLVMPCLMVVASLSIVGGLVSGDFQKWQSQQSVQEHGSAYDAMNCPQIDYAMEGFTTQGCGPGGCRSTRPQPAETPDGMTRRGNTMYITVNKAGTVKTTSYFSMCTGTSMIGGVEYELTESGKPMLKTVLGVSRDQLTPAVFNWLTTPERQREEQQVAEAEYNAAQEAIAARRQAMKEEVARRHAEYERQRNEMTPEERQKEQDDMEKMREQKMRDRGDEKDADNGKDDSQEKIEEESPMDLAVMPSTEYVETEEYQTFMLDEVIETLPVDYYKDETKGENEVKPETKKPTSRGAYFKAKRSK